VISPGDDLLLIGAGLLAGVVGTAGEITSLISYPALLAAGLSPLRANVTNIASVVAGWPGSAVSSRPELAGKGPWWRRWSFVTIAGGLVGSALLLFTPSGVFTDVVPYLLLIAAVGLLLQPRLSSWRERRVSRESRLLLPCGVFAVSMYNGYFGAGAGVMLLALLLITVDPQIATANARKNMLVGVSSTVSAALFVALGRVEWNAAIPLAAGCPSAAQSDHGSPDDFPATCSAGSWPRPGSHLRPDSGSRPSDRRKTTSGGASHGRGSRTALPWVPGSRPRAPLKFDR
jgi:hypothetical protein